MNFSAYFLLNYNLKINNNPIEKTIKEIKKSISNKTPILMIGNGGSAYIASHFSQDLSKIFNAHAWSLSDNFGTVMAIANDIDYEQVFSYQLAKFGKEKLLICFSFSGNSNNIVRAARNSNILKSPVISFTGSDGGNLKNFSDLNINIPTENIYVAESYFSIVCHYIIDSILEGDKNAI